MHKGDEREDVGAHMTKLRLSMEMTTRLVVAKRRKHTNLERDALLQS